VDFGSHTVDVVESAVSLVNAFVPGEALGRAYPPAENVGELQARADSLGLSSRPVSAADAGGLAEVADELREIFRAVEAERFDDAAAQVNSMIVRYDARPTLLRHGGPWHLHFHGADAGVIAGNGGSMAVGLAYVLGSEYADRIGVCSAPACDRVYVDVSRNGTKRFCSTACQNRVKAAAFRARRAAGQD
jgi:predicted RNA-binding Zn ribbon-like protein